MKPLLLRILPPIFRVIERYGLSLPRKFFKQASQYTRIPKDHKTDNVMPSVSEIPTLLTNIRQRGRAVSIGPQSEADAYETLAYRERRHRNSISPSRPGSPVTSPLETEAPKVSLAGPSSPIVKSRRSTELARFESMMGTGFDGGDGSTGAASNGLESSQKEVGEKEIFSRLQKLRVRYDVEVVTKLFVYSGIAWIAVEANPVLFKFIGLAP